MKKSIVYFVLAMVAAVFCGCAKKAETSEFVMVTEATFPPYEFLRGSEIVGVDVEICKAIAKELGKELKINDVKFEAVIPSVTSGKADIAAAGITVTEDRKNNVDFSIPYVTSGIVIIAKKGSTISTAEALKGIKVGVQSGTTSDTFMVDELKQEPDRFDSPAMAVAALKAGKIDAVVADIDPAKNLVKDDDSIEIVGEPLSKEEFAVAFKKGSDELVAVANKVIARMIESGEIEKFKAQYDEEAANLKSVE